MKKLDGIVCDGCGALIYQNPHKHDKKDYCDNCNLNLKGYVNNCIQIENSFLDFDNGEVYLIQLIIRKKDTGYNTVLKSIYIKSLDDFHKVLVPIKVLCDTLNVRAYIQLNPIIPKKLCIDIAQKALELIRSNEYNSFDSIISSCAGKHYRKDYFVVDVDEKDYNRKELIKYIVSECRRNEVDFYCEEIPTVSGYHLVVNPFDVKQFNQLCLINHLDYIEVKKQAMTLLYCDLSSK